MRTFIWLIIIALLVIGGALVVKGRRNADPVVSTPTTDSNTYATANETPSAAPTDTPKASAITTKNGMKIETTQQGTGPAITTGKIAVVQYEGKLTDGSIFDSTAKHGGTPFEFQLGAGRVIQGWEEGILGMKVGETRMLTIPPELGYGAGGYPPIIPQNATLFFTVTLQGIK
jgi:FKBP-type peptidyl-prolyl cis-trans isomerase